MIDIENDFHSEMIGGDPEYTKYSEEGPEQLSSRDSKASKLIMIDRYRELKLLKKYLTSFNIENYFDDNVLDCE